MHSDIALSVAFLVGRAPVVGGTAGFAGAVCASAPDAPAATVAAATIKLRMPLPRLQATGFTHPPNSMPPQ
jgi:hypothetical protein